MTIRRLASSVAVCIGASAQAALAADETAFSLGVSFNYSTGEYGTGTDTEILSVPITARYERGPLTLKLTVPYLRVSGGTSVVPGVGQVRNTNPRGRGRGGSGGTTTTTESTESGLGDTIAAATYNVYYNSTRKLGLDLTGKVKFGTADADKGLGTGETDYGVQADVYKTYDRVTAFAGLGYTVLGSSEFIQLDDVWNASVGASYRFTEVSTFGVAYDWRERSSPTAFPQRELSAFWVQKLSREWKGQAYVLKGFSDGSPDWGVGASLAYAF